MYKYNDIKKAKADITGEKLMYKYNKIKKAKTDITGE
jgi:hypothetical protein